MKNPRFFPLFFVLAFAVSLFPACSGDSEPEATPTPSINDLLPKQLYLDVSLQGAPPIKYEGDGVINIHIGACEIDAVLPAGTIKNGQTTWELPEISGEYLKSFPVFCDEPSEMAISNPNNLKFTSAHIGAVIPGYGSICLSLMDSENRANNAPQRYLEYYSGIGEIKGSAVWDRTDVEFYDLKISKGWNIIYGIDNYFDGYLATTNPTPLVGELVLWENCSWNR